MGLVVKIMKEDADGQWTGEVADEFAPPFDVAEIRTSNGCEWQFIGTNGEQASSVDL